MWGVADRPIPGIDDPRLGRILSIVAGGLAAVLLGSQGLADSNPMPGLILSFAAGCTVSGLLYSIANGQKG
jgi:hypothetical protein